MRPPSAGQAPPRLPNIRFHDLRHACASLRDEQGLHPGVVMGHTLTMNTYAHVIPDLQRQAADTMDGMYAAIEAPASAARG